MSNTDDILDKINEERIKFIAQKGYEPNRIYLSSNWFYRLGRPVKVELNGNFFLFGMEVFFSSVLEDNYAVMLNTKDLPDFSKNLHLNFIIHEQSNNSNRVE